jgi:hypothetical protein
MNENEMTDLELDIATDLAIYSDNSLAGKAFWDEVERLMTFGKYHWATEMLRTKY